MDNQRSGQIQTVRSTSPAIKPEESQPTPTSSNGPSPLAVPCRKSIVPTTFYTLSLAKDRRMDRSTLAQAFNATSKDLSQLLNAAAVALGERGCLGSPARSKAMTAARHETVLEAIRSIPFFGGFFDRHISRYLTFKLSMTASIVRICEVEYKEWHLRKREEAGAAMDNTNAVLRSARPAVSAGTTQLPTPPATPRKQTPARNFVGRPSAAIKRRRIGIAHKTSTSAEEKKAKNGRSKR